jgi:DNA-binding transcriptional regulator YiaG
MEIELSAKQIEQIADIITAKLADKLSRRDNVPRGNVSEPKLRTGGFVKISEFAREFNVTVAAVHKWIMKRKIFAQKIGERIWRIPVSEIEDFRKRNLKKTRQDYFERNF